MSFVITRVKLEFVILSEKSPRSVERLLKKSAGLTRVRFRFPIRILSIISASNVIASGDGQQRPHRPRYGARMDEVGGDLLTIEAAVIPGKGKLVNTGSLGDVMQESIQAAMTVVRARAEHLGISDPEFYQKNDVHIRVPEGLLRRMVRALGSAYAPLSFPL